MTDTESNVVEVKPTKQEEANYADETKIFDTLAGKARIVVGEAIGVDSTDDWPGWMFVTEYDWPWFEDLEGEQNSLDEEKLGIDDEDFDISIEMFFRVDTFVGALRRFSDGGSCDYRFDKLKDYSEYDTIKLKRKWEAKGRVVYDIGDRTINLNLLVRNGARQRIYADVTWKAGEDKPIAEEYSVLKADVADERFHGIWDHWDHPDDAQWRP